MRTALIAAAALLAATTAQAQVTTGYIMVIVSGHTGEFHDTTHTMPSLDECEADAEQAARSAKGRGEILGDLKCFPVIEGDGPTVVFHKAGEP
jgi:hypothetical protein